MAELGKKTRDAYSSIGRVQYGSRDGGAASKRGGGAEDAAGGGGANVDPASSSLRFSQHLDAQTPTTAPLSASGDGGGGGRGRPAATGGISYALSSASSSSSAQRQRSRRPSPPASLLASAGFFPETPDERRGMRAAAATEGEERGSDGGDDDGDGLVDEDVRRAATALLTSRPGSKTLSSLLEPPSLLEVGSEDGSTVAAEAEARRRAHDDATQRVTALAAALAKSALMRHPPALPGVDAHLEHRPALRYANLKAELRRCHGMEADPSVKARSEARRKKRSEGKTEDGEDGEGGEGGGGFTVGEIRRVVNYIDDAGANLGAHGCRLGHRLGHRKADQRLQSPPLSPLSGGKGPRQRDGDGGGGGGGSFESGGGGRGGGGGSIGGQSMDTQGDGRIDAHELTMAFRRARRLRAALAFESEAKEMALRLVTLIEHHGLTTASWFAKMDQSQGGAGDGRITNLELQQGLDDMCSGRAFRAMAFSPSEVAKLIKFMDPNGDGDLSLDEIADALGRCTAGDEKAARDKEAAGIVGRLEAWMDKKHMRVKDLFGQLDADGSGDITLEELRRGLVAMAAPSPRARALAKRKKAQELAAKRGALYRAERERLLRGRMEKAKGTGALEALRRMDLYMHRNNMRIKDLFTKSGFDVSGDGVLDAAEFEAALQEQLQMPLKKREARALIDFLDESGDGEIEACELEAALRRLRKDQAMLDDLHSQTSSELVNLPDIAAQKQPRNMADQAAALAHRRFKQPYQPGKVKTYDPAWMGSLDKALDNHFGRAFSKV